ncbi:type II toxin-antitoxin system prevent-host-death family antitoxin [Devosia aurantiaca]|uniref:Type II toxin-antitoxin system prevent-host-death family antitoxin n=1 Tax=Devosia aurantiaca TaxID=2714858 RepID=A0A6M1SH45_9HYPH|nr:type II toxin-antitoxin system prevent-host-death family antitoxin [Devosia aurantiaca]
MKEFSLSDLHRRSGEIIDAALSGPVVLRKHGRRHSVLLSAAAYDELVAGIGSSDVVPSQPAASGAPKGKLSRLSQLSREPETEEEP